MENQKEQKATQESGKSSIRKFFVSVDTPLEQLRLEDEEGAFVVFEVEPNRFKRLEAEVIKGLSKQTRTAYFVAEAIFENKGAIPQSPDAFVALGQGGPLDGQYNQSELRNKGLVSRNSRKDLVYKRQQRGWRIATPDDVVHTQARLEGGHFETKDPKTGETDQILMVMPKERYEALSVERVAARERMTNSVVRGSAEMIQDSTGYKTRNVE